VGAVVPPADGKSRAGCCPAASHDRQTHPTAEEAVKPPLVSIAALEREEEGYRQPPGLIAESLGRTIDASTGRAQERSGAPRLVDVELNQRSLRLPRGGGLDGCARSTGQAIGRVRISRVALVGFLRLLERFGYEAAPSPLAELLRSSGLCGRGSA